MRKLASTLWALNSLCSRLRGSLSLASTHHVRRHHPGGAACEAHAGRGCIAVRGDHKREHFCDSAEAQAASGWLRHLPGSEIVRGRGHRATSLLELRRGAVGGVSNGFCLFVFFLFQPRQASLPIHRRARPCQPLDMNTGYHAKVMAKVQSESRHATNSSFKCALSDAAGMRGAGGSATVPFGRFGAGDLGRSVIPSARGL